MSSLETSDVKYSEKQKFENISEISATNLHSVLEMVLYKYLFPRECGVVYSRSLIGSEREYRMYGTQAWRLFHRSDVFLDALYYMQMLHRFVSNPDPYRSISSDMQREKDGITFEGENTKFWRNDLVWLCLTCEDIKFTTWSFLYYFTFLYNERCVCIVRRKSLSRDWKRVRSYSDSGNLIVSVWDIKSC